MKPKEKNPQISDIMWEDYCLMSVYDLVHKNSPITLSELAQKIGESVETTEKYTAELERLGLVEIEYMEQSNTKKIVKIKKDLLADEL